MTISDVPRERTYFRLLICDPQGSDSDDLVGFLEDSGLQVFKLEELSRSKVDLEMPTFRWSEEEARPKPRSLAARKS